MAFFSVHIQPTLFFLLYFLPSNEVFTGLEFNLDALNKRAGEVETEEEESHFVLLKSPQRMLAESRAKSNEIKFISTKIQCDSLVTKMLLGTDFLTNRLFSSQCTVS